MRFHRSVSGRFAAFVINGAVLSGAAVAQIPPAASTGSASTTSPATPSADYDAMVPDGAGRLYGDDSTDPPDTRANGTPANAALITRLRVRRDANVRIIADLGQKLRAIQSRRAAPGGRHSRPAFPTIAPQPPAAAPSDGASSGFDAQLRDLRALRDEVVRQEDLIARLRARIAALSTGHTP